ncbi:MmcB family DNA repair protein [Camelimonas abortus]|uniref:MmcB family DNA repair protein n=1 Tax=Camelimonas abortus TaxID=1017184 RepID=A0ABV7LHI3_9HYPH
MTMTMGPDARLTLPPDGRQSPAALAIQRGVRRHFASLGAVSVCELTLPDFRRADVAALAPDGRLTIVEIKSSVADFRADAKWRDYRNWCDAFLFAVAPEFPVEILPQDAGLLVADAWGAELLRAPQAHPLAPARRRALTLRFARVAAGRLHRLADPEGAAGFCD